MKKQTRAISAEQKEERRRHILKTAKALLLAQSYANIQIMDVANAAGLARGTLYLYFKTKEEIFLALLSEAFADWFRDMDALFDAAPPQQSVSTFTDGLCKLLEKHPLWLRLIPITHVILEQNIEYDAARTFKGILLAGLMRSGAKMEEKLTFIPAGRGTDTLLQIYAMLIGVQNLVEPAPVVKKLIAQEVEMSILAIQLSDIFPGMLAAYLTGLSGTN